MATLRGVINKRVGGPKASRNYHAFSWRNVIGCSSFAS